MSPLRQEPDQIVKVGTWTRDEEHPIFPVGSKPKQLLICPTEPDFEFLIPTHRYLFKTFPGWQFNQIWSEVLAYQLSLTLPVAVPPAFVALDERLGQAGVLVEFFYGYPDDPMPPRLIHGHDILRRWRTLTSYSAETGRPHDLRTNIKVCRLLGVRAALEWWAQTISFDALIGNTDRHTENWGVLIARQPSPEGRKPVTAYAMAPAFDNATSLGYEISDEHLSRFQAPDALILHQTGHSPPSQVQECTDRCMQFDVPHRFTPARAGFVRALIGARRDALAAMLES